MSLAVLKGPNSVSDDPDDDTLAIFERYRRGIQSRTAMVSLGGQIDFARAFCTKVVEAWWRNLISPDMGHVDLRATFATFDEVDL
ncbi:MAG: hypothetical protein RLN70_07130, partial [Rhodospirillaceae bacterium]